MPKPTVECRRSEYSPIAKFRRIVVLTEGKSNPHYAKTAMSLLRYRAGDVAAVLDSAAAGQSTAATMGVDSPVPIVARLADVPEADALFIGIAPPGGGLPTEWRGVLLEAIDRGLPIVSGLHDFLSADAEFAQAAQARGVRLFDVRKNAEKTVARAAAFNPDCLRVHTVGQDCSVGKMTAALEAEILLRQRGVDARFLATGQTGIMLRGDGVPVDCVVADFIAGATEQLVLRNQDCDVVLVEGQGSLCHPSFSGVTLGLLHGCAPDAMIMCYEFARPATKGLDHVPLKPLAELIPYYEQTAGLRHPSRVIAVAMNSRRATPAEADAERERVEAELGLPVGDVFRHGAAALVEPIEQMLRERRATQRSLKTKLPVPSP